MATIAINDLDINQELDSKALQNILGGRWVLRTYSYSYRRLYTRTVSYYRSFTRYYRKWVWV